MKYWEIIADRFSKAGCSLGWVSALDVEGASLSCGKFDLAAKNTRQELFTFPRRSVCRIVPSAQRTRAPEAVAERMF